MRNDDQGTEAELLSLRRRCERERNARLEAESIAEQSLREIYAKKEQLELLRSIAVAANESASVSDALQFALTEICNTTGWPLGHVFLTRSMQEGVYLEPSTMWHGVIDGLTESFQSATLRFRFARDIGLPGRVLTSAQPAWIEDLWNDVNFPRADMAQKARLRSAFAFPVLVGTEVVAVLEFFSREVIAPDTSLLSLAGQIGTQLGRVVERKRTEERLIHDASHDLLTKLPNRALFNDRLQRAVAHYMRKPSSMFAVLFIDLDRFKVVNDSLGHHVGDELIVQVANRLSESIRQEDVVGYPFSRDESHMVARLGGDEFTIFLEDMTHPSDALQVADRIQLALGKPFHLGDHSLHISASIGIAWSTARYTSANEILRDADMAMYRAKDEGKARYAVYDDSMYAAAVNRLETEASLRRALEREEFVLHYQPIVRLESAEIVGFEALVRWRKNDTHLIYPDQFIDIAEDTGLILALGAWVLRKACQTVFRWNADCRTAQPLTISVNLSGKQLCVPTIAAEIKAIIRETGIDPQLVKLELTESVTMGDPDRVVAILSDLRRFGVRFSIDDFGTGYSSLSYLHKFPLHTLKIDKSFVMRLGKDEESLAIVKTILALAHSLNMDVIAEGTETAGHCAQLAALGCEFAQGYFYSRPTDEAGIEALLQGRAVCPYGFKGTPVLAF
ncbi:MAG: putative bifunctional diguanylate cyclase/phosphodiesterase [Janthinobacterium lividum]